MDRALNQLHAPPGSPETPDPVRASGRLRADLDYGTLDEILDTGIHEYIDSLQARLNSVGNAIFETYVLYANLAPVNITPSPRPVVPLGAWHSDLDVQMQQQQQ